MTYFESLLVLLLAAIVLLQIARRLSLPYPAMLAASGVGIAFLPGTPTIPIAPETALALFIAPAIVDAAYDFPPGAAKRFWAPLVTFVVFAVLITTLTVAGLATHLLHLPLAAALVLGAIVAPPDAAAATAVLGSVSIPRNTESVLKGESLFNDASALLLFSGALAVQAHGSLTPHIAVRLALAIPGGLLLGYLCALLVRRVSPMVKDTLGGNLIQFVYCFLIWRLAERLGLSAVLCTIAFAMTIARNAELTGQTRMRVQSYAVWGAVVFALNVFAFLIMGMQAKQIVGRMSAAHLKDAATFAGIVVLAVIVVRLVVVVGFNRLNAWRHRIKGDATPASVQQAMLVGWSGMRGFVTLATAFALPEDFPQRDVVVLTAFSVVLATLVLQGLTLAPLIRRLGLERSAESHREIMVARAALAEAALAHLETSQSTHAAHLRAAYELERDSIRGNSDAKRLHSYQRLAAAAVEQERIRLEELRAQDRIGITGYLELQEEIDWRELNHLPGEERKILES